MSDSDVPTKKRKKSKKKGKKKLPRKIIVLENKEKSQFKDEWYEGRDPLDLPRPFRCVLSGPPSSGKSMIIKNIMARGDWDEVYLIHLDDSTIEYDDIDIAYQSTELPPLEMLKGSRDINKLLICEDLLLNQMSKQEIFNLDRLFGNVSSHSNVSIFWTSQDPLSIPLSARRMANVFLLWKQNDHIALQLMCKRTGQTSETFGKFFRHCKTPHDFIMLDCTANTPFPIRLNGYQMLSEDGSFKN